MGPTAPVSLPASVDPVVVSLELHATNDSDAVNANVAARVSRLFAEGIARSAKSGGSAIAQNGHAASAANT